MAAFPPGDLCGFLQLSAGDWLALRSLLETEAEADPLSQAWHASERGELRLAFLEPGPAEDCGSLLITLPDASSRLWSFRGDGTVLIDGSPGSWRLGLDGSLELEVRDGDRVVRERIWFCKPNLRLRSTLEQFADGQTGRASFSTEIRRVRPPQEVAPASTG